MTERSTAARLAACGSASVHGALGNRFALAPGIRPLWPSGAVAGPADTVAGEADDNLALHQAVADAPDGVVIVATVGRGERAIWGSVLSSICQARAVAGFVTDGLVRDTDRIRQLAFPVFCAGVAIGAPTKQSLGSLQARIEIGGVAIEPGDWVVADGDGVVAIPQAQVGDVLAGAEAVEAREAELIRRAIAGEPTTVQLGLPGQPGSEGS